MRKEVAGKCSRIEALAIRLGLLPFADTRALDTLLDSHAFWVRLTLSHLRRFTKRERAPCREVCRTFQPAGAHEALKHYPPSLSREAPPRVHHSQLEEGAPRPRK